MAKKRGNPLSGKFRDPPREGNAAIPTQADQDEEQIKLTGASPPEQISQGVASTEPPEPPADPVPTDPPAPEQADQDDAPSQPTEAPADPAPTDTPGPEQTDQGDAPSQPPEAPADPAPAEAPGPEQVDQGDAPSEPAEAPAEPMAAGMPTQGEEKFEIPESDIPPSAKEDEPEPVTTVNVSDIHPLEGYSYSTQDDKDMWALVESIKQNGVLEPVTVANRPAGGYEMIYGHRRLRACQLAGIQTIPTIIVRNFNRDAIITVNPPSVYEKAPVKPTDAPADPEPAEAPAPEQADQDDAPSQPTEAPAQTAHAEARFVTLLDSFGKKRVSGCWNCVSTLNRSGRPTAGAYGAKPFTGR